MRGAVAITGSGEDVKKTITTNAKQVVITTYEDGKDMKKLFFLAPVMAGLIGTSLGVQAADFDVNHVYVGAGMGITHASGFGSTVGLKAFGGYKFNEYLSAEAELAYLGNFSNNLGYGTTQNYRPTVLSAMAVGTLPFDAHNAIYGKLGLSAWSVNTNSCVHCVGTASGSGTDVTVGIGYQYTFFTGERRRVGWMPNALRAEYQYYNGVSVNMLDAGVVYDF